MHYILLNLYSLTILSEINLRHPLWRFRHILLFSFSLTFLSGFGQSFFISLFIPTFLETSHLSNTTFGTLYALATLISGFALPWAGRQLDHISVSRYSTIVFIGLVIACFVTAFSKNLYTLSLAIFLLRFFGQGLFGHTSDTITAKKFGPNRGKALSIVGLGYPVSEAILPMLAVFILNSYGLQITWISVAIFIASFIPFINFLANSPGEVEQEITFGESIVLKEFQGLKNLSFWVWASATLMPPFLLTSLFLYNAVIAQLRGWSLEWMATSFIAFAICRFMFSIIGGPLVDKLSAKKLYPWHLIPLAIGIAILALWENKFAAPSYLALSGISIGLGAPIKTALWAEIYDIKHLAKIRSWLSSFGVIGTAAGPPVLALMLDSNISLNHALLILSISLGLVILICGNLKRFYQ